MTKADMALNLIRLCAELVDEVNKDSELILTIKNDIVSANIRRDDPTYEEALMVFCEGARVPNDYILGQEVMIDIRYKEPRPILRGVKELGEVQWSPRAGKER